MLDHHVSEAARPAPSAGDEPLTGLDLTVVVPTFNERGNVAPLVERLRAALDGVAWQVIFVDDDSADGTAETVKQLARSDPRIQCLHRLGRRGLAGAVLEGVMASPAAYVAVIDGDLQHDERLLPRMLKVLQSGEADIVIGSRYVGEGSAGDGFTPWRLRLSDLARRLAAGLLPRPISDPVSGFFMTRRAMMVEAAPHLSGEGFKILFDFVARQSAEVSIVELPYRFAPRLDEASKFDGRAMFAYAGLLLSRAARLQLPPRSLTTWLTVAAGAVLQMAVFGLAQRLGLAAAQTLGALAALTFVFLAANATTYRDRRRRGWRLLAGYVAFCAGQAPGLLGNLTVALVAMEHLNSAGLSALIGAVVGAIWTATTVIGGEGRN